MGGLNNSNETNMQDDNMGGLNTFNETNMQHDNEWVLNYKLVNLA